MFSKLYESLYLKIFVNIIVSNTKSVVYIESTNKQGYVDSSEAEFDTKILSAQMRDYILSQTKESPYTYISVLDYSTAQGAIPACSKQKIKDYYDMSFSEYKCYDNKWSFYTLKNDIFEIKKTYDKIGVDFIFSPFVILANFFKDKIDTHTAMFILVEENILSLSIFSDSELLFAEQLDTSVEVIKDELMMENEIEDIDISVEEEEASIDLDSIDLDDIDSIDELDDFGDIEDLDAIEEINEFNDSKDIEEELADNEDQENFPLEDSGSLNDDYQRFVSIQSSVNNFYRSSKFKSEFIENVYIADAIRVSSDLKKYLEEEMFLNVYIRHIDLCSEVCETAKIELS